MAIISSLRSQPFRGRTIRGRITKGRKSEATEQLIVFRLCQEWFALPITAVQRVVTLGDICGDPQGIGIGLTRYQDQELMVIDVGRRIFAEAPPSELDKRSEPDKPSELGDTSVMPSKSQASNVSEEGQHCLIVVQNSDGDIVGLPIQSQPEVRRVPKSSYVPLPPAYKARGNIRCVSSMMVRTDTLPLFLLDPDQLLRV